jgi:hypothetical protein
VTELDDAVDSGGLVDSVDSGDQNTGLWALLFPDRPRELRGRRAFKIVLRAAHVLCAGILVGSYMFDVEASLKTTWLLATVGSGVLILFLDLHESAAFLFQVRGLVIAIKIGLVATLPLFDPYQAWVLALVVVGSVMSSHAPSKVRYFMLVLRDKVQAGQSKG